MYLKNGKLINNKFNLHKLFNSINNIKYNLLLVINYHNNKMSKTDMNKMF